MEQHPIPQQISSYQFRLVGDMTLKQFLQVGGGVLIALIIYSTPIIGLIKWPLVIISALMGAALAFLPFQERPLEKWIFAFLKSIYSPTLFYWKRLPAETAFFQEQPTTLPAPSIAVPPPPAGYPELAIEITPIIPAAPKPQPTPLRIVPSEPVAVRPMAPRAPEELEPGLTIFPNLEEAEKTFLSKITGLFSLAPTMPQGEGALEQGSEGLRVTPSKPVRIEPIHAKEEKEGEVEAALEPVYVSVVPTLAPSRKLTEEFAQFSQDAAPPFPPSLPNVIVGQVMDSNKKIVEGAILEIKDSAGRPVRALKSNKLGHFMIVMPLTNGRYTIEIKKNGLVFEPLNFDALGNIIPPIAIKARSITTS